MNKDLYISGIKRLSGEQLEHFCRYWNTDLLNIGARLSANGLMPGQPASRKDNYERHMLQDGWTLFEDRAGDKLLLCDGNSSVRLKGHTGELKGLLFNIALTDETLETLDKREYGLVLSGGGAKGAFEIGVWRWLEKTGLMDKITGISGTSVGALNSLLFSRVSLEEAEEIWRAIRQDDLTHVKPETLKKMAAVILQMIAENRKEPVSAGKIINNLLPLAADPMFNQDKLSAIVDQLLKTRRPGDKIVFSCLARESRKFQQGPPSDSVLAGFYNADYYCLNNREDEDIKKIVLASSAIPFVYDPIIFNHFEYRDGGCRDNTPCLPLIRSGFKKLIVVHLKEREEKQPYVERAGDSILYHVYPTIHVKKVIDTLHISGKSTEDWLRNGEEAAEGQLGQFLKDGELIIPEGLEDPADRQLLRLPSILRDHMPGPARPER